MRRKSKGRQSKQKFNFQNTENMNMTKELCLNQITIVQPKEGGSMLPLTSRLTKTNK